MAPTHPKTEQERRIAELVFSAVREFHRLGGLLEYRDEMAYVRFDPERLSEFRPLVIVLRQYHEELARQLRNFHEMPCISPLIH